MTVETNDTVDRYAISGVGPYAFTFRVFDKNEVTVTAISAGLVSTSLSLTTNYTVSGVNDEDGGSITLVAEAATTYAGYTLDIRSNTAEYQPTSIRNQGRFLPEIHEDVFDRLSRQIQDLSRKVRGAIRYPDDGISDAVAPAISSRAGRYLYSNATTGAFEWATAIIGTALSQSIFNLFLADSDQYKRTAGEIAAGVTPTNYAFTEGDARRYGMIGDDSTDNDAAIVRLRAVAGQGVCCTIPPGIYRYTTSPNWAINNLQLSGERGTILKHTGTGVIFNMDAGADSSGTFVTGMRVSDLILTGNANSTDALFSRGVTYSSFKNLEARSCSAKSYHIKWGVANTYDTCIINRSVGGTFSPVPTHGWYLTNAGTGYYTADCTFIGCVAENFDGGVSGVGADFHDASGNTWVGGTFESLAQGLVIRAVSKHNSFDGVWFEANATNDIVDLGTANTFKNLYAGSASVGPSIDVNGGGATFIGGYLLRVELASGSFDTTFIGCAIDENGAVGITGSGPYKTVGCYKVTGSLARSATINDRLGVQDSYTGTLTGCTTSPTGSINYSINGNLVTLEFTAFSGTSNSQVATVTGMPAAIRPPVPRQCTGLVTDNGASAIGTFAISAGGTITLYKGPPAANSFTGSGSKGVDTCSITYSLMP